MKKTLYALSILMLLGGCASKQSQMERPTSNPEEKTVFDHAIDFTIVYQGVENDADLLALLKTESSLKGEGVLPPFSVEALKLRAENELPNLKKVLYSFGYFDAHINVFIEEAKESKVTYVIEKGKPYKYNEVLFEAAPGTFIPEDILHKLHEEVLHELDKKKNVSSKQVIESAEDLVQFLQNNGYPFAKILRKEVIVLSHQKMVDVSYVVDTGYYKKFGPVQIKSFDGISDNYIRQEVQWKEGTPFNEKLVEKTRQKLYFTGLFDSVTVVYDKDTSRQEVDESLPLEIKVTKAPDQVIGGGVKYMTSSGPGVKAFWRSINLLGNAETLDITGDLSKKKQALVTTFVRPHFMRKDQSLHVKGELESEHPAAYRKQGGSGLVAVERKLSPHWKGSAGVSYEKAHIRKEGVKSQYDLTGFPLTLKFNNTKPPILPTSGLEFSIFATPFPEALGADTNFLKLSFKEAIIIPINERRTVALKFWSGQGLMPGGSLIEVPATKRFYLGGESSLRSYGFQMAGPLDSYKDPAGGRSFIDGGIDLQVPIEKDLDGVIFTEGGSVFTRNHPNFKGRFFSGAGTGARYKTSVGVLKFDIGIPFYRRHKIDDPFQLYFGIGSTF